jgi:hypothetical protein
LKRELPGGQSDVEAITFHVNAPNQTRELRHKCCALAFEDADIVDPVNDHVLERSGIENNVSSGDVVAFAMNLEMMHCVAKINVSDPKHHRHVIHFADSLARFEPQAVAT